jgi:ABC-type lipoprotein release transport system permease subunit
VVHCMWNRLYSVVAVWLTRILTDYLFGITPLDIGNLCRGCAASTPQSLIAAYGPARWASRIDPVECLRAE